MMHGHGNAYIVMSCRYEVNLKKYLGYACLIRKRLNDSPCFIGCHYNFFLTNNNKTRIVQGLILPFSEEIKKGEIEDGTLIVSLQDI